MTRIFQHRFDPPAESPISGSEVELTVREVEAAGIKEVLQSQGAKIASWEILEALLEPTGNGSPFVFREPLGHSREVKVAASGLFGRFVARAYLERYFSLTVFASLGSKTVKLDGRRRIAVKRVAPGDLPDWVACKGALSSITVAEAKGCHDKPGPEKALDRAWKQANRISLIANGSRLTVKRIAIATRWASTAGGSEVPILAVHDPVDIGDPDTAAQLEAACIGLVRIHLASLLEPLGYRELGSSLRRLATEGSNGGAAQAHIDARQAFAHARTREIRLPNQIVSGEALLGRFITRAGPMAAEEVTQADNETMRRLALRPMFVGIERDVVRAAIEGDAPEIRTRMDRTRPITDEISTDQAGTWIVELGMSMRVT